MFQLPPQEVIEELTPPDVGFHVCLMKYGKTINLNENGQRVDANGNQMPWREGSLQPSFATFAAIHGGVAKAGSEVRKDTGEKVPHVQFKDGTEAWGGRSVIEAASAAREKGEKFSLQACSVGEYVRAAEVTDEETGITELKEQLYDDGRPAVAYALFIAHVGEDDTITY